MPSKNGLENAYKYVSSAKALDGVVVGDRIFFLVVIYVYFLLSTTSVRYSSKDNSSQGGSTDGSCGSSSEGTSSVNEDYEEGGEWNNMKCKLRPGTRDTQTSQYIPKKYPKPNFLIFFSTYLFRRFVLTFTSYFNLRKKTHTNMSFYLTCRCSYSGLVF